MNKHDLLAFEMIHYENDTGRIQHFLKVRDFCHLISIGENMPEDAREVLETAALVHDIGIKAALEKYGYQNGKLQEELGPALAAELLRRLDYDEKTIERVCFLIAHHHTFTDVNALDHRILLEADWLVNNYEYSLKGRDIYAGSDIIFKTETGKRLFAESFGTP